MIIIGTVLSLMPYNHPRFETVHEFTIQCHMRSDHFLEVYGRGVGELDWCLHNTGLSLLLYGILGMGGFLIYKSKLIAVGSSENTVGDCSHA